MFKKIPAPIINVLADNISDIETHASLDNLFLYAGAPDNCPEGSKFVKAQAMVTPYKQRVRKSTSYFREIS